MNLFTIERNVIQHTHTNMYGVEVVDATYPARYEIDGNGFECEVYTGEDKFLLRIQELENAGNIIERDVH